MGEVGRVPESIVNPWNAIQVVFQSSEYNTWKSEKQPIDTHGHMCVIGAWSTAKCRHIAVILSDDRVRVYYRLKSIQSVQWEKIEYSSTLVAGSI